MTNFTWSLIEDILFEIKILANKRSRGLLQINIQEVKGGGIHGIIRRKPDHGKPKKIG